MDGIGKTRIFNRTADPFRVEAMVRIGGSTKARPIRFGLSRISYIFSTDTKTSAIAVENGPMVHVALPLAKLDERLYNADLKQGNLIDLKDVTGDTVDPVIRAAHAMDGEYSNAEHPLKLRFMAHATTENSDKCRPMTVYFSEIKPEGCHREPGGTLVYMRSSSEPNLHSTVPFHHFEKALIFAEQHVTGLLDITAASPKLRGFGNSSGYG